ncbi:MAG: hypothetical protein ACHQKY_17330 [Terriglobia bacterium]
MVKEAWSAIEKNFVDPTYNHQDWTEVRKELLPVSLLNQHRRANP